MLVNQNRLLVVGRGHLLWIVQRKLQAGQAVCFGVVAKFSHPISNGKVEMILSLKADIFQRQLLLLIEWLRQIWLQC